MECESPASLNHRTCTFGQLAFLPTEVRTAKPLSHIRIWQLESGQARILSRPGFHANVLESVILLRAALMIAAVVWYFSGDERQLSLAIWGSYKNRQLFSCVCLWIINLFLLSQWSAEFNENLACTRGLLPYPLHSKLTYKKTCLNRLLKGAVFFMFVLHRSIMQAIFQTPSFWKVMAH